QVAGGALRCPHAHHVGDGAAVLEEATRRVRREAPGRKHEIAKRLLELRPVRHLGGRVDPPLLRRPHEGGGARAHAGKRTGGRELFDIDAGRPVVWHGLLLPYSLASVTLWRPSGGGTSSGSLASR